jgi:hypothetical protein
MQQSFFGVYVVYCLIEATRLITADKNNNEEHWKSSYFDPQTDFNRDGRFRERDLVNSWIMHIFNPINMLNLFLAAISNSPEISEKNSDEENVISNYFKYLEENGMNTFKTTLKAADPNLRDADFPPTTLDLVYKRVESSGHENHSEPGWKEYWKQKQALYPLLMRSVADDSILYDLDEEKITGLKNILKHKYPLFYSRLQSVDKYFYSKYEPR